VIRKRLGRLATVITAGTMALLLLGAGGAVAKTPSGWSVVVTKLPATVKAGNVAGYDVTIRNDGPSNVNAVTFTIVPTDTPNATPAYFPGLTGYTCTATGQVVCDLGTMAAGTIIKTTVAYNVPPTSSGTFDVSFQLKSGSGYVIGNNQSRGDAYANLVKTSLSASQNFDAGFVVENPALADLTYATGGTLGRNNKHNSQVDVSDHLVTVTIEDEPTGFDPCATSTDPSCATTLTGWTRLTVPNNQAYIKVTLNIWGGSVPGGIGAEDIHLIHVLDNGDFVVLGDSTDEICSDPSVAPTSGECIKVTKVGSNFKLVGWLLHNGGIRGGY
jgi:uncharacterized repeat protein (TIGR01451 family)